MIGAALWAVLGLSSGSAGVEDPAAVGEVVPDFDLGPMFGHDGRHRLAHLRGQPVLILGFRQHLFDGLHAAKIGDELHAKYAKAGLVVILRQRESWSLKAGDGAQTWSFWRRFFESDCWLANGEPKGPDLPIRRERSQADDRSVVLLGVDGRLLLEERAEDFESTREKGDLPGRIERLVIEELSRRKKGWGEERGMRDARARCYAKGDHAGAWKAAERLEPPGRELVQEEVRQAVAARAVAVQALLELGRIDEAEDTWKELSGSTGRIDELESMLSATEALWEDPSLADERRLEGRLRRILRPADRREFGKVDFDLIRDLRALVEKNPDTRVGRRAQRLDPYVKSILGATRKIRWTELETAIEHGG